MEDFPLKPKLILSDQDSRVLDAWRSQLQRWPDVEIRSEDPLQTAADALLLPGNSFGLLDAGLEFRVLEAGGWETQDELRQIIQDRFDGELLVGQAAILRRASLPRPIVYAPIWRIPWPLANTVNVFLAVRGALLALKKDAATPPLVSLVVPAMGVAAPGGLDPRISARQIRYAYEIAAGLRGPGDKNLGQISKRQKKLQSVPLEIKEERDD